MRTLPLAMILAFAVAGAGCSKPADTSSSSTTTTTTTTTATDAAGASAASAAPAAAAGGAAGTDAKTGLPLYPGATAQASGSSGGNAGTVLTTNDSFDKVYGWYKDKMPAGSEKAKLDAGGMSTATFQVDQNGGKGTVAITSQAGKTTISLAQTKS